MPDNKLLYGFDETPLPRVLLKSGPFSMLYENGSLRYIKYGDNEILRMIYIALRDENWGTYAPIIENEKISSFENSFSIEYLCRYEKNRETIFTWRASIRGDKNGKIVFSIQGEALKDVLKNRAGFCILHPIKNTAGQTLTVTHSDSTEEKTFFPISISPIVPATDITKLTWTNNGHKYRIEMEGESFEMEDHRNWTDASFKSYCTPLSFPYPVQLKKGDKINQQVSFYPLGGLPDADIVSNAEIYFTINESETNTLPLIGIDASTEIMHLSPQTIELLKGIKFDYYTIDIKTSKNDWPENLLKEIQTAGLLQTGIFIRSELGDRYEDEFASFADIVIKNKVVLKHLLILSRDQPVTQQKVIDWIAKEVKKIFLSVATGIGTETNFAELNRNRRELKNIDFISYAIHPQEHAFDNLSLIENLGSQHDTVQTAKEIYPGTKTFISPVTLRRRINPYASTKKEREWANEEKIDPRQISLWNAGWALGSIKYLAEAGAYAATYFQTAGKQGICDEKGNPYPVAVLFRYLCALKNARVVSTMVNEPLRCSTLLLMDDNKKYLLIANHSDHSFKIKLPVAITKIKTISLYPSSLQSLIINETDMPEIAPYNVVIIPFG